MPAAILAVRRNLNSAIIVMSSRRETRPATCVPLPISRSKQGHQPLHEIDPGSAPASRRNSGWAEIGICRLRGAVEALPSLADH